MIDLGEPTCDLEYLKWYRITSYSSRWCIFDIDIHVTLTFIWPWHSCGIDIHVILTCDLDIHGTLTFMGPWQWWPFNKRQFLLMVILVKIWQPNVGISRFFYNTLLFEGWWMWRGPWKLILNKKADACRTLHSYPSIWSSIVN